MADMDLQIKIEALSAEAQKAFESIANKIDAISEATKQGTKSLGEFERSSKSLNKIADSFTNIGSAAKKAGQSMSLYVTAPLVALGALAIKEFSNAQGEVNKLNQALANSGRYSAEASRSMRAYADELEKVSIFSAGAITDSLALATSFSRTNQQAQELVSAAADLAVFMGTDLNSAVRTLGMTLNGQAGRVGQMVKGVNDLTEAQLRAGGAITLTAQQMSGQAAAAAQTLGGQLTILKNELNGLLSIIGRDLAPFFQKFVGYLRELVQEFKNLDTETRRIILIVGAFAAALGPILLVFGQISIAIGGLMKMLTPLIALFGKVSAATMGTVAAVAGLALAAAGLVNVFFELQRAGVSVGEGLKLVFNLVFEAVRTAISTLIMAIGAVLDKVASMASVVSGVVGESIQDVANAFGQLSLTIGSNLDGVVGEIDSKLEAIGTSTAEAFTFGFSKKFQEFREMLKREAEEAGLDFKNGVVGPVAQASKEIQQLAHSIGMNISGSLSNAFIDFASGAKSAKDAFKDFATSTLRMLAQMILQAKIFKALFPDGAAGSNFLMGVAGQSSVPVPGMATGGPVVGPGSGTSDSILTRLSNGEFVVRAAAVRSVGLNFMNAINSMGSSAIPKFASGGLVGGGGPGSIVIENKGSEKQATSTSYDAETGVTTIVLEDLNRNGPISKALQSNYNVKRGGFR